MEAADYDIDGSDAAVKAVALANVLVNADAGAIDVAREGIRSVEGNEVEEAARSGIAIYDGSPAANARQMA